MSFLFSMEFVKLIIIVIITATQLSDIQYHFLKNVLKCSLDFFSVVSMLNVLGVKLQQARSRDLLMDFSLKEIATA